MKELHGGKSLLTYLLRLIKNKPEGWTALNTETWTERESHAGAIGKMDFGCGFIDGMCKKDRKNLEYYIKEKITPLPRAAACCRSCGREVGYLVQIPKEAVVPLYSLYDREKGFLTDKGCSIPYKWRSSTCLLYACDNARAPRVVTKLYAMDGHSKGFEAQGEGFVAGWVSIDSLKREQVRV